MTTATYVLEVDWNGDDDFSDTGEDVTARVMAVECVRGRDRGSQLTGAAVAGRLTAILLNSSGDYSPLNSGSAIAGNILPNRKVRLRTTSPSSKTLFAGYLDSIKPNVSVGPYNTAVLVASGPFKKLAGPNAKVSPPAQEDAETGTIVGAILDEADWPAGDRDIDTDGIELKRWFIESYEALSALHEIEEAEGGFLREGLAWDIVFETRYHRFLNSLTSQATFSDANGATHPYESIEEIDPLQEIFNEFTAIVQPYEEEESAVLWTLQNELPTLAAGESRTYIAAIASGSVAFVDSWTTPVAGTDIIATGIANGDIGISVVKKARSMEITITNNHVSAAGTFTLMQARGIAVSALNPFKITDADSTSQTKYGKRAFPLPSPWYSNAANAESAAAMYINEAKNPRAFLSIGFTANKSSNLMTQALSRDLSERITVVAENNAALGIDQDFYIETIAHRIDMGGTRHSVRFELSPAGSNPGYWILETADDLDTDTVLGW